MVLMNRSGYHSGQTRKIYSDMSRLTTAKQIVKRIIVEVE